MPGDRSARARHTDRNHQGLDNLLTVPLERPPAIDTPVETSERLGGMLHSYRRAT